MLTEVLNLSNYAVSPHAVGPWVVGILIAILGIVALLRERGSKVSLAFCALTMSVAIWLFSAGVLYSTLEDRKSTRLNSSHSQISYAVFCLKKKKKKKKNDA